MRSSKPVVLAMLAASGLYAAPAKEIVQIQRDIALLQDQVRAMQQSMDQQLVKLVTLVEQALQSSTKANTSLAVLENGLRDRLSQQLATPIAGVSSKVDQMSNDFAGLRETVSDMNERVSKIQAQLVQMDNTVRTLQAPPPPPSGDSGLSQSAPPPGVSPTQLYETAMKDRSGGNLDLARQGFEEYLKWFGNTDLASSAQYYIGAIHYDKNEFAPAIQAFDSVLERYPENNRTADAMYMKGMALLKSGQRTQAGAEFLQVLQKYPSAEVAPKARAQRRALGLSVPSTPAAKRRR